MNNNTDRKQVIHEIIAGMGVDAKMRVLRDYLHMNVYHMTEVQIDFMFEISRDQDVQDSLNANESCDCDKCQTILKNGDPIGPFGGVQRGDNRKPSTLPFSWQLYQVFDYKVVTRDGKQVSKIEKTDYENSYPLSAYCDKGKLIGTYTMDGHFRADKLDHSGDLFCVNK